MPAITITKSMNDYAEKVLKKILKKIEKAPIFEDLYIFKNYPIVSEPFEVRGNKVHTETHLKADENSKILGAASLSKYPKICIIITKDIFENIKTNQPGAIKHLKITILHELVHSVDPKVFKRRKKTSYLNDPMEIDAFIASGVCVLELENVTDINEFLKIFSPEDERLKHYWKSKHKSKVIKTILKRFQEIQEEKLEETFQKEFGLKPPHNFLGLFSKENL